MLTANEVAEMFVEVADTLVDDYDLIDFLHGLTVHAAEATGSSAVGLLLTDPAGGLSHVAASSERAEVLELLQLQHIEGPCVECASSGQPVVAVDLAASLERWPRFAPQALAAGVRSVHAFPMRLRREVIGALNVFSPDNAVPDAEVIRVVQSLADIATISLLHERALVRAETLAEQLQYALNSRVVIEQAKGAVARAYGVGVDEAFDILRDHARRSQSRLTAVAAAVVEDPAAMRGLMPGRRPQA